MLCTRFGSKISNIKYSSSECALMCRALLIWKSFCIDSAVVWCYKYAIISEETRENSKLTFNLSLLLLLELKLIHHWQNLLSWHVADSVLITFVNVIADLFLVVSDTNRRGQTFTYTHHEHECHSNFGLLMISLKCSFSRWESLYNICVYWLKTKELGNWLHKFELMMDFPSSMQG